MKVELEIPEGDIGKSVHDILKNLAWDQKRELCRQVMLDWISSNIHKNERELREKELVEEIRKSETWYHGKSDKDIRDSHTFTEMMRTWRNSHEIFVKEISEETIRFYKEEVRKIVEHDPAIQAMRHEVAQIVKETFPKMVHDAILEWFGKGVGEVLQGAMGALRQVQDFHSFNQDVGSRLSAALQRPASDRR